MKIQRIPPVTETRVTEKVVSVEVTVEVEPETYQVSFTRDQLKTFYAIGQVIGGSPDGSPRGATAAFNRAVEQSFPEIRREIVGKPGFHSAKRFFDNGSGRQNCIIFKEGSIND